MARDAYSPWNRVDRDLADRNDELTVDEARDPDTLRRMADAAASWARVWSDAAEQLASSTPLGPLADLDGWHRPSDPTGVDCWEAHEGVTP